ncbi:MAG: parvulin peptidyl-prolyl isomerase [Methylophaga sp.]|nr:MAG: parvulin peptidyl-prolyl isomerase [Methylophaga sp.]
MLHFIRERAQGWVAWFIVGLISIPFALWGVNSYLNGPSDIVIATVNDVPIKQAEFKQAMQQYRERMRNALGEKFDPDMFDGSAVKQTVLNGLIDKKLLSSASHSLGQYVSDNKLSALIQATPAFQKEGVFDQEYYSAVLARVGLSPSRYELELRQDLLMQELTNNVQQTSLITQYKLDDTLKLEKQTRDIAYGVIAAQALLDQVDVSDDEIQAYYDSHQSVYTAPERVSVNYVELSVAKLAKTITIDEAELQQFYVDNEDQFVGPEQRKASHILIEESDELVALEKLAVIKTRLDNGEEFSSLAVEFSQDSGSASEGGDLGFFQHGVMDIAFETTVFALKNIGDISEPVKTEFGYHLIQLTGIQAAEGKSFTDAHDEILNLYSQKQAEEKFYEQAEQLADLSYENPENLDLVAEDLELEIMQSATFTRNGGSGIAANKKVVISAFSEDVLVNNLNSAVIEIDISTLLVLHKKEHIQASQLPLKSVAPTIVEQLKFEKASKKASEKGQGILEQLRSGVAADTLFAENDWQATEAYGRINPEVSPQVLEHAFSVVKPEGVEQYTGFTASNGNYIVVKVSAVTEGDLAEVTAIERDGLQSHLVRILGNSELAALIASLKEEADIQINQQYLR